jgi:hypothetical protein
VDFNKSTLVVKAGLLPKISNYTYKVVVTSATGKEGEFDVFITTDGRRYVPQAAISLFDYRNQFVPYKINELGTSVKSSGFIRSLQI